MCKFFCCCCIWCRDCCCPREDEIVMTDIRRGEDNAALDVEVAEPNGTNSQAPDVNYYDTKIPQHNYHNIPENDKSQAETNGTRRVETPPNLRARMPVGDLYYAKYDFDVNSSPYVQCSRGERLKILEGGESWSLVELENKEQGYIPNSYMTHIESLESYEWYFATVSRQECDKLLQRPPTTRGTFMVRDCLSKPGQYSLSVLQQGDRVSHYRIFHDDGGFFLERNLAFASIPELIGRYQDNVSGLLGRLITPCKQRTAPPMLSLRLDSLRIDRSEVKRLEMLDAGNFGKVYKGRWKRYIIAIKTRKTGVMNVKEFLEEAETMSRLRHKNVVQICGVVCEEPIYIITEYMSNGSLLDYMREALQPQDPWTLLEHTTVSIQISDGMSYLEERSYIHRDLRAANILVGENLVCKVADFGLARFLKDPEYVAKGKTFPVRWTAPEAITYSTYSHKSDIWSFGVLLYEVATKGGRPYGDMGHEDVMRYVQNGNFLAKPDECDDLLYSIMTQCWGKVVDERPTFSNIKKFLCDNFGSLDEPSFDNE